MFRDEQEPLTLLLELSPRLAKKRYRQSIYEAWHHQCGYCGEMATSLDHIVPRFRSGSSNRNNLVPACRSCNANKGSKNMKDWYKSISKLIEKNALRKFLGQNARLRVEKYFSIEAKIFSC